jgi:hypothetical protein
MIVEDGNLMVTVSPVSAASAAFVTVSCAVAG